MEGHKPHGLEYFPLVSGDVVYHYTCNSPPLRILERKGIVPIGSDFGCKDVREVLKIPLKLLEKKSKKFPKDKPLQNLTLEKLMRDLK